MVAVEIRPPPARTKIGALACYAKALALKKVYHRTLPKKIYKDNVNQDFEKYETNKKKHLKLNAYLKR